ncbi:hypothetical protein WR25_15520 [Diploscapter pachys]|uniref:Uncharacterized protein n=1 Tax=Diploscapter pachys TaxID=2018661 RepID=A0A2A2KPQ1_9BILA|nr:hypothetical protein WR25_15520 [Diploscapter pachys]
MIHQSPSMPPTMIQQAMADLAVQDRQTSMNQMSKSATGQPLVPLHTTAPTVGQAQAVIPPSNSSQQIGSNLSSVNSTSTQSNTNSTNSAVPFQSQLSNQYVKRAGFRGKAFMHISIQYSSGGAVAAPSSSNSPSPLATPPLSASPLPSAPSAHAQQPLAQQALKKWGILSNLFQPANGEEEESETEQHNVGQHSINAGNTNKKGGLMSALGKLTRR